MIRAFFGDPHFGHENVIEYSERPFKGADEMGEALIGNYNRFTRPEDLVIWTGDAFLCSADEAKRIMSRLKGHKILVRGNHDGSAGKMASLGFDAVVDEMVVRVADVPCIVSHYPFAGNDGREDTRANRYLDRRPRERQGFALIHGHTHSKKRRLNNQIHVGVDAWDYCPAMLEDVEELVREWRGPS